MTMLLFSRIVALSVYRAFLRKGMNTMPFIPATNVIQVELVHIWDNQIVENVLHYQRGGGVTEQAMDDVGSSLVAWWNGFMDVLVPTTLQLTEIRMTDLTDEFAPGMAYTTGLPLVGGLISPSLPNNVSVTITKRTNYRGRAYRGRIYHIGLCESQVTDNKVVPATLTQILAAYNGILSLTLDGVASPMVVVSKYQGGLPRGAAVVTPVVNLSSDGIIDSQRRRLPKRGT